jgi:hypothetical protein
MASGLVQLANGANTTLELLDATTADGVTAIAIILAMSLGLILPKIAIDRQGQACRRAQRLFKTGPGSG